MTESVAGRAPRRRRPTEWLWLIGFPLFLVAVSFFGYQVARNAGETILESRDGQVTDTRLSPSSPGYRLIVEPTVTGAIAFEANGELAMVSLLLPVGDTGGGTWLIIPADTLGPSGSTLASSHLDTNTDLWVEVSELVGIQPTERAVLDAAAAATLIGPAAAIVVELADDLVDGGGVRFASGINQIDPNDIPLLLGWLNPGESIGNRLTRQQDIITAWIDTIVDQPQPEIGEVEGTELGSLVRRLTSAAVIVEPISIVGTERQLDATLAFRPDDVALRSLVRTLAPFAQAADTVTLPKTLVLNGASNDLASTIGVARLLGANGAQVTAIGNADDFLQEQTMIRYSTEGWADTGAALVDAMGVGVAELDPHPNPAFDLVVLIGSDTKVGS